MRSFFEQIKVLDDLKNNPEPGNVEEVLTLIRSDESLCIHFYGGEDNRTYPNFGWLKLLYETGEFDDLNDPPKSFLYVPRFKSNFIKRVAQEPDYSKKALEIMVSIKPKDDWIQWTFLEAVEKMPDIPEQAIKLIWDYLGERKQNDIWHWQGEAASKIMVRLTDSNSEKAFAVAKLLLDIWSSDEENSSASRDAYTRFRERDYAEFVEKYYKQLWEKFPYQSFEVLTKNLDAYLADVKKKRNTDLSEYYYVMVERIDEGSTWGYQDFASIYMNALRDCLNYLIEHESENINTTLELLRSCDKAVFTRFEIYLLSKVGTEKNEARINEIAQTYLYFEDSCYANEYDLLISSKEGLLTPETKKTILDWVEAITIRDPKELKEWFEQTFERECTADDISSYEARYRAQRLYPIKGVFPEYYKKYKQLSEADDEALKPTPLHSDGPHWIPDDEGTPLSTERMNEMSPDEVLDYVAISKHYNYTPKEYQSNSPKEALGYAFQIAVKARPVDFINADIEKIVTLPESFVSRYFNGLWDALRENSVKDFNWDRYLEIAQSVVKKFKTPHIIIDPLRSLVECIQEGFKDANKIGYEINRLNTTFSVVEPLLSIQEQRDTSNEQDPVQIRCNSVTGEALLVCLSLGVIFKREFKDEFEKSFKSRLQAVFDRVLTEIKTSWTICTFGSDFSRIYWLVPEWVDKNIDLILSDENWVSVWGTYLHWGRPSKELFNFLSHKNIYNKAINKKDDITIRGGEKPSEELARHFVIAYFNGWIESYDDKLLQAFLNAAPDKELAYTAQFFTTGFETQEINPIHGANEKLKIYWEKRLAVIKKSPEEHIKEASALAYWIKDCPLDITVALKLEEQTLSLSNGKLDDDYKATECIEALCSYANDKNQQIIIRSIRLIVNDPPEYMSWDDLQESLDKLLDAVVKNENASPKLIQDAMALADDLGWKRQYHYKDAFEKLARRLPTGSSQQ